MSYIHKPSATKHLKLAQLSNWTFNLEIIWLNINIENIKNLTNFIIFQLPQ